MSSFLTRLKTHPWEIAAFCLPIAVRLVYLLELYAHPGFDSLMVDEKWHWLWAHDILETSFWGTGAYFRGPLYPYFLSFLVWITESSVFWAKAAQLLLCGGIGLILFRFTKHLFDDSIAKVAVVIYALYGTFIFYDTMFLVETLFLLFALWGVYRLVVVGKSGSAKQYLWIGILFGLSALARPNILLVLPFLGLWLLWKKDTTAKRKLNFFAPLTLAAGVLFTIAPVTIRNYLVTGDFILISSQGGVNLYIGNNPSANGLTMLMPELTLTEAVPWDKFVPVTHAVAEKEEGRTLTEAEASAHWSAKAWNFIGGNFGQFLDLTVKKVRYLFCGYENSDNGDIYYQRTQSHLYALLVWSLGIFFPFGLLLPLTSAGIWLTRNKVKLLLPMYITILAYIPSIILFLVTARHRLLLVLLFIPFAAYAIVWLARKLKKQSKEAFGVPATLFIAALVLCNIPYYEEGPFDQFQVHYNEAIKLQNAGEYASAEKEYFEAIKYYGNSAMLYNNLAQTEVLLEKPNDAERYFRQAISIQSNVYQPYRGLGFLFEEKKNNDSALAYFTRALALADPAIESADQIAQLQISVARNWQATNHSDSAVFYYRLAAATTPAATRTLAVIAGELAVLKQFALVDSLFSSAEQHGELSASELSNWGFSYLERKEFANGEIRLHQAYIADSSQYRVAYNLAVTMHELKMSRDSVNRYVSRALLLKPDYDAAIRFKGYLQTLPH